MILKKCENCGEECPPRIRKCKKCGNQFVFKVKKKKIGTLHKVSDWKSLESGDHIRVSGGPVWPSDDSTEKPMGYSGIFEVVKLDDNGIVARGFGGASGYCHIWMGEEKLSSTGMIKRPHKISKLKNFDVHD